MRNGWKRLPPLLAALCLLLTAPPYVRAQAADGGAIPAGISAPAAEAGTALTLGAGQAALQRAVLQDGYAGRDRVAVLDEGGTLTWQFDLEADARFYLTLVYCAVAGQGMDIEIVLELDGKPVAGDTQSLYLNRVWADDPAGRANGRFATDNQDNELVPHRVETLTWQTVRLRETGSVTDEGLAVSLRAGTHTLRLIQKNQCLAVRELRLENPATPVAYSDYVAQHRAEGAADAGEAYAVTLEAEMTSARSDNAIYPIYDRSSPATSPNDPQRIRLNTIGGERWSQAGQWIEWTFTVGESGFYILSFKYRQDTVRGLSVHRRIAIDGTVPFAEFEAVGFPYGSDWQRLTPSDEEGEPFRVYLTAGDHTLRLEAVVGPIGETIDALQNAVLELNSLYRSVVMVTGSSPDFYRDYYLDTEIPDLIDRLKTVGGTLRREAGKLDASSGVSGNQASFIYEVIRQIDDFVRDSRTIPERLSNFKGNIGSLAELITGLTAQPLELDTLSVAAVTSTFPRENASFFSQAAFRFQAFLSSFQGDYAAVGNVYGDTAQPLTVWINVSNLLTSGVASGRDQAQTLKRLIDETFQPTTGIPVNLSLVSTQDATADALMLSIMGGKGPDVALFVPEAMPVSLAMRGALTDVSTLSGYEEIYGRMRESAWIPYRYNGGVYAVPETQTFQMLFYRKDIFEEMGLTPPDTWDDFYTVVSRLEKKNMQVGVPELRMQAGVPESATTFEMLLLQNGGTLYTDDLSRTALDTQAALNAFQSWTDLYLQYSLPLSFDFFNRFRTGEMPMGIASYTMYSQLAVAAPEIRNLWGMLPIPGVERDGAIVRSQSCIGTASVLLASSDRQADGWRFLDWWTSAETQKTFGNEIEAVLGASARYNTANTEAFRLLPWSQEEQAVLLEQWEDVWDIPQTPASYAVSRNLANAFRKVVYDYRNPREILSKYSADMDREIARKREEFGLGKEGA